MSNKKVLNYLLSLVSKASGLIGAGGAGDAHNSRKLPVLPAANPKQKPHHIGLLLLP